MILNILPHFFLYTSIWLISILRFLVGQRRFAAITPPFFQDQKIYDRATKTLIAINIRNHVDWFTLKQIFLDENYNLRRLKRINEIRNIYESILANSQTPLILDVGANIGLSAKYFNIIFPNAKIIAVEPELENILQAKKNISNTNINLLSGAISCSNGAGRLTNNDAPNNAFRVIKDPAGNIPFYSIDTIIDDQKQQGHVPFIIKIDIEGHESFLFEKNTNWVENFPLLIIELHDWMLPKKANSRNFLSVISKYDRDFVHHGENIFSISNEVIK